MSADYEPVRRALSEGLDAAMLCQTCPWDRPCVSPPTMTRAEIDAQIAEASSQDEARAAAARAAGRDPGLPTGMLLTAMTVGSADIQAQVCPVFALRLRSSAGRTIADRLRDSMQAWDDQS